MTSATCKNRLLLFIGMFCLLVLPGMLNAATYYVSATNGNDSNSGTSRDTSLKTVGAATQIGVAGDTVLVLAGTYDERVQVSRSGSAGAPITYQAEGTVVCRGFTVNASYIRITGFEISDTDDDGSDGPGILSVGAYNEILSNYIHDVTRAGVKIFSSGPDTEDGSNCIVSGNRITRAGNVGIHIQGRNHLVEWNEISHSLQHPPKVIIPLDGADADGLYFFGSGHVIRKNRIHDISLTDPENVDPHIDCFETWGPAYNIVFEQNFCSLPDGNSQGFMIEEINAPVQDITVRNNVIKAFRALNVGNCPGTVIVNNTFAGKLSYQGDSGYGIELHSSPTSTVANNLFYDVGQHSFPYLYIDDASWPGTRVGYNAHYISDGEPPAGSPRHCDLFGVDPKLVNAAGDDFRLRAGSPLIDNGVELPDVTDDYDGVARPQDRLYDIGAFEFEARHRPRHYFSDEHMGHR